MLSCICLDALKHAAQLNWTVIVTSCTSSRVQRSGAGSALVSLRCARPLRHLSRMAYLRTLRHSARALSTATKVVPGAGITLVQTPGDAKRVLDQLMSLPKHYHACDTEVANIDVATQSPVGNGNVICATIYSGPEVDFGSGPRLWIDNLGSSKVRCQVQCGFWLFTAPLGAGYTECVQAVL